MGTAFVLGGGGVLGAAEVGMLRALLEAGIEPDLIVGTSIGDITGLSPGNVSTKVHRIKNILTRRFQQGGQHDE